MVLSYRPAMYFLFLPSAAALTILITPSLSHDPTAIKAPIILDYSYARLGVIGGRRVGIVI